MKLFRGIILATVLAICGAGMSHATPGGVTTKEDSEAHYVYFDGTFTAPMVWAWVSDGPNCTQTGSWPGDAMVQKEGKWYWELPAGKEIPTNIIISQNNEKIGGGDLVYSDKATYHQDGSFTPFGNGDDPNPDPNPDPEPNPNPDPTINLETNYYKVNPNGQTGTQKTVTMTFDDQKSTTAMSNWSESDIIAQGVARDVSQAFRGVHERPIIDSYAIYAAYDNDNLYLGLQLVYLIWDIGGEGKQPGESKPYNMDGRLMWAFDIDPNKSFDGYIDGTKAIWNDNGQPGAKFANGVDAIWIGSSKPGVGTPGFFIPTPEGHASYDAAYCKSIPGRYYGYADGLHPTINNIYGQKQFGYNPDALTGNEGFVDLKGEIATSAHTFYEWKFPLSVLGVSANFIKNYGIGVMFLDIYGSSPVGGTPYDPSFFDNCKASYSMDPSTSKEKEDEDVITYSPARIGKLSGTSDVNAPISVNTVDETFETEYYTLQGVRVSNPLKGNVMIVRQGNKVSKQIIR